MALEPLIAFYNAFSAESVSRFPEFYSSDAYFKDPFNEVRGVAAIQRIFTHMFEQVAEPRFVVVEQGRGRGSVQGRIHSVPRNWSPDVACNPGTN
jgi:ketosteroid isomerase-like protein